MRNFIRLILPFSVLVVVFFFLQRKNKHISTINQEKVLDVVSIADVKNIDPVLVDDVYCAEAVSNIYEGLLEYDYFKRPYQIVPQLAASMPVISADNLVYTFKIKEGVYFQNNKCFPNNKGRELVAEDFVYSLKRIADHKLNCPRYSVLAGRIKGLSEWHDKYASIDTKPNYDDVIEGLKAIDKYTLQITLTKPFPQLLHNLTLAYCSVVPKEAVDYYKESFINNPVGTGPFTLASYNPQANKIVYLKNLNYRDEYFPADLPKEYNLEAYAGKKLPLIDKVVTHIITEEQTRSLKFKKGEIDLMELKPNMVKEYIKENGELISELKDKGVNYKSSIQLIFRGLMFNNDLDIFKNKKLRQAMSLAFDDDTYKELFLDRSALVSQSLLPFGAFGYRADYVNEYKKHDLDKAKKLLSEAGYPNGKGLPEITIDCGADVVNKHQAEFFKNCMEKIGINVKVVSNSWLELHQKIDKRSVMVFVLGWSADYFDSESMLQVLYGPYKQYSGINFCCYDNPAYNMLYEKAVVEPNEQKREELYFQMNKLVGEDVPMIFLPNTSYKYIYHGWVNNYIWSDFNHSSTKYVDVDMVKKRAF
jgi:oligopeptide transport system substrate-binding protein